MSKSEDVDNLFELYAQLQNLMRFHVEIDERLKELSASPPKPDDFEPIKTAATAIINTCGEIEKSIKPPGCQCCRLG